MANCIRNVARRKKEKPYMSMSVKISKKKNLNMKSRGRST